MYNKGFLKLLFLILTAWLLPLSSSGAMGEPPEQPYRLHARMADADSLLLTWEIAEGTYLYQEKIEISLLDAADVTLGEITLPPPTIKRNTPRPDGTVGDVAVYYDRVELPVPLLRTTNKAREIKLKVKFQGCADQGICYPPKTELFTLSLPTGAGATAESLPEQQQILNRLSASSLPMLVLLSLVFGLTVAFTACMYPMIPILSSLIVGHKETVTVGKGLLLSLFYVEGMALTFGIMGAIMGFLGETVSIQAYFQKPVLLIPFALLFVALALSMFGFFSIQIPTALQSRISAISSRQRSGSLLGVGVMGVLSALIIGPCGGPFLIGELAFAAQSNSAFKGFLALTAFGNGMGLPLLLVGAGGGKLLPKAGTWMDWIKPVAGVVLLAIAIIILERMPSIFPPGFTMILWALLLIIPGIYLGAFEPLPVEAGGWNRFWKGLGVGLVIYGTITMIGGLTGGRTITDPLYGIQAFATQSATNDSQTPAREQKHGLLRIKSSADLDRELADAANADKIVLLDFYADWCTYCQTLENYVFPSPEVQAQLQKLVALQADITDGDELDRALMRRLEVPLPPAILFFGTDGNELKEFRITGNITSAELADHIKKITQ
jgi:thiol:disulfide interchange protein DsbD